MILFALMAMAVTACKNNEKEKQISMLQEQTDSLNLVISQKNDEINDVIGTLNDIESGFREITEAQGRVTLAQRGESSSSVERIRENMQYIQSTMQQNRDLIKKLQVKLRESGINSEQLKRTIDNLSLQLQEKDEQLRDLRETLLAKEIRIAELDETIADLNEDVAQLKEEGEQKTETINTQDQQLHTAWYVFGTKKELKEQNILAHGEVLQENFNKDYFTKIDIRVDKEIKLYSRDAVMLTSHPQDSYTLQRDANKQYVLKIKDPQAFWSMSKYLVIQVK